MHKNYKSKLYYWVLENFSDSPSNAPQMSSNANNTHASGHLPFSGTDYTGGQNTPIKNDIAGEELKNNFNGITKFSELKEKANNAVKEIKTVAEDCLKKECTADNYVSLLDIIQKPEVLSLLEHMRQEIKLKEQDSAKYN